MRTPTKLECKILEEAGWLWSETKSDNYVYAYCVDDDGNEIEAILYESGRLINDVSVYWMEMLFNARTTLEYLASDSTTEEEVLNSIRRFKAVKHLYDYFMSSDWSDDGNKLHDELNSSI